MRLQKGVLTPFEKRTGISANQISAYLRGDKDMSKARSLDFEEASKDLGYNFTAADWMFSPEKVKSALGNQNSNHNHQRKVLIAG